jgi:hypothetical protein
MSEPDGYTDLTVTTNNPRLLDQTLQQLPSCAAAVIEGPYDGVTCTVRVFSGLGFVTFALANQGYGKIRTEEVL